MSSPIMKPSVSGFPEESSLRRFRNVLLELKKTIQSSHNIDELNQHMEHFINANRKVDWKHSTSETFRKNDAEKAVAKVTTEYQRYIRDLRHHQAKHSYQDLLDALAIVETMLYKISEKRG